MPLLQQVAQHSGRLLVGILLVAAFALPATAHAGVVATTPVERAAAADAALKQVGRPYRRGSTGPGSFDCSGLVDFAYRAAKRPLRARTSFEMWNIGTRVTRAGLQRGDLVWTWDRSLGHVGVYVGMGRYVHAPGAGRRVEIALLPSGANFIGAVRP